MGSAFTALLACDLDGTVLDADSRVGASVATLFAALRRSGVAVVAATGRRFDSAAPILREAGLDGWCVVQNGSSVRELGDGRRGLTAYLSSELAVRMASRVEAAGLDPVLFTDAEAGPGEFYVPARPRDPTGFLARYLPSRAGHHTPVEGRVSELEVERVTRVVTHAPVDRLRLLREDLGDPGPSVRLFEGFDVTQGVHRFEFMSVDADKWRGVAWVAGELGIPEGSVVAVGDDANDVEMLRGAACSFATPEAHPLARAAASVQLQGASAPDAVVAALRSHYGLTEPGS